MREIPVTEARAQLSELVSQVAYGGQPVVLTRHGKALVALVPAALLHDTDATVTPAPSEDAIVLNVTTLGQGGQRQYSLGAQRNEDGPIA